MHLYVWHECEGGISTNEFTSCILDYLEKKVSEYNSIVIISDGFNYKNQNKVLAYSLRSFAKKYKINLRHVYLEKGHTMMSVDTVHNNLEAYF